MAARTNTDDEVISRLYDGVTFHPGMGDSGKRVDLVEEECEKCHYDRMVRVTRVSPVEPPTVTYACQKPGCPDFHRGDVKELGYIPTR